MRNGFKSSRGAIRGTMGGVPICLVGAVGFATVAIGSGPFLNSLRLEQYSKLWLNSNYAIMGGSRRIMRSPLACAQSLDRRRGRLANRNATIRHFHAKQL